MRTHDKRIIWGSTESDYRTPPEMIRALSKEFEFELDAAASNENKIAEVWMGPDAPTKAYRNGLGSVPWAECTTSGAVWLNPPYSKKLGLPIEPWIARAAVEGTETTMVALLPAAVQTKWWLMYVQGHGEDHHCASEVRFFPHRVSFLSPQGKQLPNAGVNHCLVIWRPVVYYGGWVPAIRYWTYRA